MPDLISLNARVSKSCGHFNLRNRLISVLSLRCIILKINRRQCS